MFDLSPGVHSTDARVKTVSSALLLAQQWKIWQLELPDNMSAEAWAALSKVISCGEVTWVDMNASAWRAANIQQKKSSPEGN